MGFGYLLIGYLITHFIYLTASGLGIGGLALLLGYAVMMMGLKELTRYHKAFAVAKWMLIPMVTLAVFDTVATLDAKLLWQLSLFSERIVLVCNTVAFAFSILFNLVLLYAIRMISEMVGIKSMAVSATRNMIFVCIHAVIATVAGLPIGFSESIKGTLNFAGMLLNIVWIVCNLLLLLACNKNICRKGDEEQAPRRSRFKWFNKIDDIYEKNKQEAVDSTREYAEEVLRRRREQREKKNKRKK